MESIDSDDKFLKLEGGNKVIREPLIQIAELEYQRNKRREKKGWVGS